MVTAIRQIWVDKALGRMKTRRATASETTLNGDSEVRLPRERKALKAVYSEPREAS